MTLTSNPLLKFLVPVVVVIALFWSSVDVPNSRKSSVPNR